MTARLTTAEARRLGLDIPPTRQRTTRKTVPTHECGHTMCTTCHTIFATQAAEDRHVNETHHRRYASILETTP